MSLDQLPPKSFEERLDAYSKTTKEAAKKSLNVRRAPGYVAGAAAALAMGNTEAEATVYVVQVNHVMDPGSNELAEFSLDIDTSHMPGGRDFGSPVADFGFQAMLDEAAIGGRDWFRMGPSNGNHGIVGSYYSAFFNSVSRLSLGATLDPAAGFFNDGDGSLDSYLASAGHPSYPGSSFGGFVGGAQGYIGFQLFEGADYYLGWIEVRVDSDNGGGEIIRYGISDTPNLQTLEISGIPEPSALSCLALGAAGLLGWRQRRKNVA